MRRIAPPQLGLHTFTPEDAVDTFCVPCLFCIAYGEAGSEPGTSTSSVSGLYIPVVEPVETLGMQPTKTFF